MNTLNFFSPLGWIIAEFDNSQIFSLHFSDYPKPQSINNTDLKIADQITQFLNRYFKGENISLNIDLKKSKSQFYQSVYNHLNEIQYGQTITYSALASSCGNPNGQRSVAKAMASNEILIAIPCHRVVGLHSLGGYSGQLWRKKYLLALENGHLLSIGLHSGRVKLSDYNPIWKYLYEIEEEAVLSSCKINPEQIQHFGSTSINGISAKPVIDIILGIDPDQLDDTIQNLSKIGYTYKANFEPKEWHFLTKGFEDNITHHLHLCHYNSFFFKSHIAFRDYLLNHPDDRADYQKLKLELQTRFADDRPSYTKAKDEFIKKILNKCEL